MQTQNNLRWRPKQKLLVSMGVFMQTRLPPDAKCKRGKLNTVAEYAVTITRAIPKTAKLSRDTDVDAKLEYLHKPRRFFLCRNKCGRKRKTQTQKKLRLHKPGFFGISNKRHRRISRHFQYLENIHYLQRILKGSLLNLFQFVVIL